MEQTRRALGAQLRANPYDPTLSRSVDRAVQDITRYLAILDALYHGNQLRLA